MKIAKLVLLSFLFSMFLPVVQANALSIPGFGKGKATSGGNHNQQGGKHKGQRGSGVTAADQGIAGVSGGPVRKLAPIQPGK